MSRHKHEFLPRNHSAEYGDLDKSNWKNLKVESNWRFIDPAIQRLIRVLNERGFRTLSSCSGGHKRNLNHPNSEHEPGYVSFFPPSGIVYKLYFALRKRYKHFEFEVVTRILSGGGTKRIESTELTWQLERTRTSMRNYYDELFEHMVTIVRGLKPTRHGLQFSELSDQYG